MRQKTKKQRKSMGTFYVRCKIENHVDRSKSVVVPKMLVDTGSDYTWIPAKFLEKIGVEREKKDLPFLMANGESVTRSVGFAIIRLDKYFTIDEVVFAERGDLALLGARTLDGLNLTVEQSNEGWSPPALYPLRRQHDQRHRRACENSNAASATVIDGASLPGPTGIGPPVFV